ncbi:MAG: pirin family protein [Phycisphaerales bacterium]|nr:pirin family protein [Phycisphaerales bacterium]
MATGAISVMKRAAGDRGTTNLGWLQSRHTFSFGQYRDPARMGYRALRVINDDIVQPGQGFDTHAHSNMEILSYVISGELEHKDSLGNGRTISEGELQYMSAGAGVRHSEFNPSATKQSHFLQIWIEPAQPGGEPRYFDMDTRAITRDDALTLFASPDGRDGSVAIRQDAEIHFGRMAAGATLTAPSDPAHGHNWIHVIRGKVIIHDTALTSGDGAAIEAAAFDIHATEDSEFLLFRLT